MRQNKRAIVIGASSGIGLEVAKLLIKDGWHGLMRNMVNMPVRVF